MKTAVRYLILVSVLIAGYYLYRADYVSFDGISSPVWWRLTASFMLLFAGFIASSWCWWLVLATSGTRVPFSAAIASHGLTVFAKYLPGKIWTIIGRAGYLASAGYASQGRLAYHSAMFQLLHVVTGLLVGIIPLIVWKGTPLVPAAIVSSTLLTAVFLCSGRLNRVFSRMLGRLLRRDVDIPVIAPAMLLMLVLAYLGFWSVWCAAFWLMVGSFHAGAGVITGFALPLAASAGILAIIVPGGIGVREGVLTGVLVLGGLASEAAAGLAVFSRAWFTCGEVVLFITAFSVHLIRRGSTHAA